MPLLRSWDSLGRVVLQICRRYAAGSVRSGLGAKPRWVVIEFIKSSPTNFSLLQRLRRAKACRTSVRLEGRQRLRLQAERLWVLADNRGSEKARHVVDVLALESCVQFIAVLSESADATAAILLLD